jgi:hypothetical protein
MFFYGCFLVVVVVVVVLGAAWPGTPSGTQTLQCCRW